MVHSSAFAASAFFFSIEEVKSAESVKTFSFLSATNNKRQAESGHKSPWTQKFALILLY